MAGEQSLSAELQIREDNGDSAAAFIPRQRFKTETPFRGRERIPSRSDELVYFFPRECLWSTSARGFGQLKGGSMPNMQLYYTFLIEHIFHTAFILGEGKKDGFQKQFVTWTLVPLADNADGYAGFLVRVIYQIDPSIVATQISDHIQLCDKESKKGKRHDRRLAQFEKFTSNNYQSTVEWYLTRPPSDRQDAFQDIHLPDNAYNPFRLFTLESAVKHMRHAGAHADFLRRYNYLTPDQEVVFPRDGAATFLIPASQMDPASMRKFFFPHAIRSFMEDNVEFNFFMRHAGCAGHGGGGEIPAAASGGQAMQVDGADSEAEAEADLGERSLADSLAKTYQQNTFSADIEAPNTLDAFKERVKKKMNAVDIQGGNDPQRWANLRRTAQKELLVEFFNDIFTPDETADCGDALRAIAKWYLDFLRQHRHFCMPTRKSTSNLSRFGDLQSRETAAMETVWALGTAHQHAKSLRLATMHVYYYTIFHVHTALMGEPGSGKSNIFGITLERMINGTSRDIAAESAKAKMTPGRKTDLMVEFFEDIPPSQLGISSHGDKNHGTSNTDQEALLKYRLTKGRVKGVYKQVINGVHSMVEVQSYCNTVMLIGLNSILSDIPKPIQARFNCIQFQYRSRRDALGQDMGMFHKYAQAKDPELKEPRQRLIKRDQRNQCFHAIIQLLCFVGIFRMPDMRVASLIWTHTLNRAKDKGLHAATDIRHFERLHFHCETTLVEDAIDRVLDSEVTPLDFNKHWHIFDLLHFEKHLYANTEHAAFVLGLLQHQWENPVIMAVEKWFRDRLLKHKIRQGPSGLGRVDVNPRIQQDMSYYYVIKIDTMPENASGAHDRDRATQQNEHLQRFVRYAHSQMSPAPAEGEVLQAMRCLMELQLQVPSKVPGKESEKIRIPALAISREGEVMISEAMILHHEKDRLQACLRDVLSYDQTNAKNILYGRTKDNVPHVWQTMKFDKIQDKKLAMASATYFSDESLTLTNDLIAGTDAALLDPSKARVLTKQNFRSRFNDTYVKYVDEDLDEWIAHEQATNIGLKYFEPTPDAPDYNTSTLSITKACMKRLSRHVRDRLMLYPKDLPEVSPDLYRAQLTRDQASNPDKFSLRQGIKRKREGTDADQNAARAAAEAEEEQKEEDMDDDDYEMVQCSDGDIDDDASDDESDNGQPIHGGAAPQAAGSAYNFGSDELDAGDWNVAPVRSHQSAGAADYRQMFNSVINSNSGYLP